MSDKKTEMTLEETIEELQKALADAGQDHAILNDHYVFQKTRAEQAESLLVLAVEGLEAVEWMYCGQSATENHRSVVLCPWCQQNRDGGHADDCQRQLLLAKLTPGTEGSREQRRDSLRESTPDSLKLTPGNKVE